MNEGELLKKGVIADPNDLGFLVYADYLDEKGLDSSMWREPSRYYGKMVINGDGGDGSGNVNSPVYRGGGSGGGGYNGSNLSYGGGGNTGGGYGDGGYNDGDGGGGFCNIGENKKIVQ